MSEQVVLPGEPPIAVTLKPSARARRLSLRVSRLDGRVTLTLPRGAGRREALAFAREKADWIRHHLETLPIDVVPVPGGTVMYRGDEVRIVTGPGRVVRAEGGAIVVPQSHPEKTAARIAAFFKHDARRALTEASERHATALGRPHGTITLRDTRSRWGSCSALGNLMYSWRLIMAPPAVLDYVAAHEVAHLAEMNHSAAFWANVERLYPGYQTPRRWLKQNASTLHRYRFRD